jgi:Leucine-rich repeat (LRR) protein
MGEIAMPLARERVDRHRIGFAEGLTAQEIDEVVSDPKVRILQCASSVDSRTWDLLNRNLFPLRPEIELRIYGFYSSTCDLSFISRLGNVRRFSADCLMKAVGIEHLAALEKLEKLSVGIHDLESFDFLEILPATIQSLSLGATKSKKPRLDRLNRFRSLRKLAIIGQQNGIDVLAELQQLEEVTFRSISTPGLDYIAKLPRLWSLNIGLGGIRDFSAIAGKQSLRYLELWRIQGLSDISFISSLTGLQYLFLQELQNVTRIPELSKVSDLRRLHLENMKGLQDISAIRDAPSLEQLIHVGARNVQPGEYSKLLEKANLRELLVGFGSQRKNREFESLMMHSGKIRYQQTPFIFR